MSTTDEIFAEKSAIQWLKDELELVDTGFEPDPAAVILLQKLLGRAWANVEQCIDQHLSCPEARQLLREAAASCVVTDSLACLASRGLLRTRQPGHAEEIH